MARAPFQVIVFLCKRPKDDKPVYAIFKRSNMDMWQAVSGGGEDFEEPLEAAHRETREETGICASVESGDWIKLDARASIPVSAFKGCGHWPEDLYVIPEYAFGLLVDDMKIQLSNEHCGVEWLPFQEAHGRLDWDSNRVALWELDCRIRGLHPATSPDPQLDRFNRSGEGRS